MSQRKRNPGAIRDLESIVNPLTGDITTTGSVTVGGNVTVSGTLTVEDSITMAGTQIRHPVQFGPYTLTASAVSLVTDIATWANRIDLSVIKVSMSGTSAPILQFWTGTGLVTAGYIGGAARTNDAAATVGNNHSNGFLLAPTIASGGVLHGHVTLQRHGTPTSNTWEFSFAGGRSDVAGSGHGGGYIVLPSALTKLSVGTVTGTQFYVNGEIAGRYIY